MENIILDNIALIILLPLWIFLIIMCGRFFSVYVNKIIIYLLTLISSGLGVSVCGFALVNYKEPIEWIHPFIKINDFVINIGLQIDKLSLITALLLFIISFAVQLFSISYMKDEKKNYRFFGLLNLFNFSMASLLFSSNLFQFYVFWELVGVVSYLLIGFDYKNENKSQASRRVFLINRVGDTALLAGIIITSYYMYSYVANRSFVTLSFMDLNAISTFVMAFTSNYVFYAICCLFIFAAAVKSAQFPFYTWLQDAMEAKVPVSALLHSATMVAAGVYLLIRMMPFFTLSSILPKIILIVGVLTAIICSILASIETQPKKVLAYSTSANLGLMFVCLGLLNVKMALIYLIIHAFIKSALFILLPKDNKIAKINFILLAIAGLTLAGILLSGLGAKELIYGLLMTHSKLTYLYMFICFVTSYYISRLVILIYQKSELANNTDVVEQISFWILLFGNISICILLAGSYQLAEPFAAAIGGLALALLIGKNNALEKVNTTPKLLEKLYNHFVPSVYKYVSDSSNYIDNKILSNYKLLIKIAKIFVKITNWIENNIMNKSVTLVADIAKWFSKCDMRFQSRNVQSYNTYAFIILAFILAFIIIGDSILLGLPIDIINEILGLVFISAIIPIFNKIKKLRDAKQKRKE